MPTTGQVPVASTCVALRPDAGHFLVLLRLLHVLLRNGRHECVAGIAGVEQRDDRLEHRRDRHGGVPAGRDPVHAHLPLAVDVAVVDPREKRHLNRTRSSRNAPAFAWLKGMIEYIDSG